MGKSKCEGLRVDFPTRFFYVFFLSVRNDSCNDNIVMELIQVDVGLVAIQSGPAAIGQRRHGATR
jgi:hypothetical protein